MDFGETKSIYLFVFLSLMWFKEVDFLLVSRKRLHEKLEMLAVDFETPGVIGIE